jgi:hypothetical protein
MRRAMRQDTEFDKLYIAAVKEYESFLNTVSRYVGYGARSGKIRDENDIVKYKLLRDTVAYLEYLANRQSYVGPNALRHPVKKYEKRFAKETNPIILAAIKR